MGQMTDFKANGLAKFLASVLVVFGIVVLASQTARADEDLNMETEEALADSEAAIAEEEEARLRAQDEKVRNAEAKKMAIMEAVRAKKLESDAKKKTEKWQAQEKASKTERIIAEKKIAAARDRIRIIEEKVRLTQEQLEATRAQTEKVVAERDQVEAETEKLADRTQKIQADNDAARQRLKQAMIDVAAAKKRTLESDKKLKTTKIATNREMLEIKAEYIARRKELRALEINLVKAEKSLRFFKNVPGAPDHHAVATNGSRTMNSLQAPTAPAMGLSSIAPPQMMPASATRSARNEGWVKVRHECGVHGQPVEGEPLAKRKVGEKLYARRHDAAWMAVRAQDGAEGFMPTSCFR